VDYSSIGSFAITFMILLVKNQHWCIKICQSYVQEINWSLLVTVYTAFSSTCNRVLLMHILRIHQSN